MAESVSFHIIGHIRNDFVSKFGIPRQAGRIDSIHSTIVLDKEYRREEAFRGLSDYDRIWLVWIFSEAVTENWSPTVRPPRLGGNKRMGVFATRSPYRPNPIGLSCVRLDSIENDPVLGPVLHVSGADLMNGTPILDIKPYLPYADAFPDASGGFTDGLTESPLDLVFPPELSACISADKLPSLKAVLRSDPRPRYQKDPKRIYGISFGSWNIRFRVEENTLYVLEVTDL